MNPARFDNLTARLTQRVTRRAALRRSAVAGAAALAAGVVDRVPSQAAVATPAASQANVGARPAFLFAQPFTRGTWTPKSGASGTYTLTLQGVAGLTDYVSTGADRVIGLVPQQPFLDGFGFTPSTPPQAAVVVETASGQEEALLIELRNPHYVAAAKTLAYEATPIANYAGQGLASLATHQTGHELAASFGEGTVFIDDCPTAPLYCYKRNADGSRGEYVGPTPFTNFCWNQQAFRCEPCHDPVSVCAVAFPGACINRQPGLPPRSGCGAAGFTWP